MAQLSRGKSGDGLGAQWFIRVWVAIAVLLNVLNIVWLLATAESVWRGFGAVQEIYAGCRTCASRPS
jgi:hypothetical protein